MYEYLDRRYALALYEVAEKNGKVDEYLGDLREICELIDKDEEFQEVIKHPQISTKQKKRVFINIFKGKIDEELLSFLLILKEKLKEMEKIHLDKLNVLQGIVKTTIPLEEYEYNSLVEKLEKKYNKDIILKKIIDPEILGGIYVRIGNDIIDGTVKTRLEDLKKLMLTTE